MWKNPKLLQSTPKSECLHHLPPAAPIQIQNLPTSASPPVLKQCFRLSRRDLTIFTKSSLLLLLTSQPQDLFHLSKARAEEENLLTADKGELQEEKLIENTPTATATDGCNDKRLTKRAFLDISINGEPIGRIIIGLYGDNAPAGVARFSDLVSGAAGVSYRRKEFIKITPNYVQHGGVRSYGVDAELASKTGRNLEADNLIAELEREDEKCKGTKNVAKSVGIIVRDPLKPPPKVKLVARNGKIEIDEEQVGKDPNGTEFVISTRDSPELDAAALVVGRVLEGMDVVERIAQVKTVQENTSSPYFRAAKLIGDKRAVVAERGFNRPYSKVVVTNCGLIMD